MPPTRFQSVLGSSAGTNAVHSLFSLAAAFHSHRRVGRRPLAALLVLLGLGAALAVHAQSALFMGALQPIGTSADTEPIAIDAQGDVWIPNPTSQELLEYTAVNGVVPPNSKPVAVAQGKFVEPSGIAFDSAGDLFVTDRSQNTIYELVAVSGSIPPSPTIKTISTSSTLSNPCGLAFDGKGNLWVANFIGSSVLELQAVSGTVPVNPAIISYSGVSSSGTGGGGFQYPQGVWVDASGDVFVADTSNNAIKEMVAVSGSVPAPTASTPTINQLGSGFSGPTGVAVDSSGNVWVADYGNAQFKEMLAVGGSIPASPTILTLTGTTGTGMNTFGVAVDAHNNIYTEQIGSLPANSLLVEIEPANFGQVYMGKGPTSGSTTSQTLILEFGFLKYLETNAPAVYTQGFANKDYTDAGTGTCDTNGAHPAYNAGNTCTLNVAFTPLYPGTRLGAAQLYDDDGDLIASGPLAGDGVAPMINFGTIQSGVYRPTARPQVAVSTTFQNPENIAVDPNHNIYIADRNGCCIYFATAANNYQTVTEAITTVNSPETLNIDGAGDLIWDDRGSGRILEAVATNGVIGGSPTIVTLLGGITAPDATVIDGNGDVFFADEGYRGVRELVAVNGQIPSNPTIRDIENTVLTEVLAIDQYGNLFLTSSNPGCLFEISPVGGQIPTNATPQQLVCGLGIPQGLAVDTAGNVWVSDFYNGLYEIQAVNGAVTASSTTLSWSGGSGFGLGLDENGSVFVSLYPDVLQFDFADPPAFTWSGTINTGQTSPTTYTAFATNAGNAPLTLEVPASGTNPSINSNWTWATGASGACPSVSAGASSAATMGLNDLCNLTISFSPITGGPLTGQLTFTDDEFYVVNNSSAASANDATQSITLNGTAFGLSAPTISWTPASPITYGTALGSAQLNATAFASSTNVSSDGTFAYYVSTVGGTPATSSTILPGGSNQLCVQWTPSSSYSSTYNSSSLCVPITVNVATPTISWTPSSTTIIQATGPTSGQFDATAMLSSNNVTANGTLTYYLANVGGTVVSVGTTTLPLGNDSICVQWTPSSTYTSDYNSVSTCQSFTVMNTPTPTINWTPTTPITYGAALGSGDFSATVTYSSNNVSADGTFAYTIGTVGGTAATSSTILPGGSNQLCVQWTPSSSYASQYTSTSECLPITVNAASTSISWTPSSTSIIASTGPTSAQLDAAAMAGTSNITTNGMLTYYLSMVGGTPITVGSTLALGPATICVQWTPSSTYSADYNSTSTCLSSFTVINTQPTTTAVTSNTNPVFYTDSVTFTATITPTSGSIVPTGTVTFYDNGTQIGTGTLSASGTGASAMAKLTTSSLAIGSQSITASYPGDTNNQSSSTATALPELVEDFSVTATGSASSTIEPGTTATFTFTVSPVSPATTFPAAITLSAANLPTGATASFSSTTIASGAGSTTVTMTVTTPITTLARNVPPGRAPAPQWPVLALALLLLPLASRLRRAGRGLSRMLSLLLLVAAGLTAAAALNGCGGVPSGYFGQAPVTSSITVTGASGALSHNASVSLTVE